MRKIVFLHEENAYTCDSRTYKVIVFLKKLADIPKKNSSCPVKVDTSNERVSVYYCFEDFY